MYLMTNAKFLFLWVSMSCLPRFNGMVIVDHYIHTVLPSDKSACGKAFDI